MKNRRRAVAPSVAVALLLAASLTPALADGETTVLHLDRVVELEQTLADPTDLWVTPEDLTRINDFVLKPEGACLDDLCIPIPRGEGSDFVVESEGETWFSLTAFARKVGQEYVADRESRVWSFGAVPAVRSSFLTRAQAPEFVLPDRQGEPVRLSEFRGRKVLLLSWASW